MKYRIVSICHKIGVIWGCLSRVIPNNVAYLCGQMKRGYITGRQSNRFFSFGKDSLLSDDLQLFHPNQISIGQKTSILKHCILEVYADDDGNPKLIIGNNVHIGEYSHITCAKKIEIGNGVLTGRFVLISDNAHGRSNIDDMKEAPLSRPISSKGEIKIGPNVWIGDNVSILSGVTIGEGSIIGAGTVVTKDIPPYSVAVGSSARIIKRENNENYSSLFTTVSQDSGK